MFRSYPKNSLNSSRRRIEQLTNEIKLIAQDTLQEAAKGNQLFSSNNQNGLYSGRPTESRVSERNTNRNSVSPLRNNNTGYMETNRVSPAPIYNNQKITTETLSSHNINSYGTAHVASRADEALRRSKVNLTPERFLTQGSAPLRSASPITNEQSNTASHLAMLHAKVNHIISKSPVKMAAGMLRESGVKSPISITVSPAQARQIPYTNSLESRSKAFLERESGRSHTRVTFKDGVDMPGASVNEMSYLRDNLENIRHENTLNTSGRDDSRFLHPEHLRMVSSRIGTEAHSRSPSKHSYDKDKLNRILQGISGRKSSTTSATKKF